MVDFNEDLSFSTSDPVRKKNYQIVIKNFPVKKFDAIENNPGKDYNDYNCELINGDKLKIEFKNRRQGAIWNDIALEVYNNNATKSPGCVFKLISSKVDYYIYTWHGKEKECYIILKASPLEKWWRDNYHKYPLKLNQLSNREGNSWQSSYCFVPIKDLPKEIIYKHETFIDLNDFWSGK